MYIHIGIQGLEQMDMHERLARASSPYRVLRCTVGLLAMVLATTHMTRVYFTPHHFKMKESPKCTITTRRQHLHHTCAAHGWSRSVNQSDPHTYWRLLVDDRHRVLYCVIPKVACSSIKTFIANSTGNVVQRKRLPVHSVRFLNTIGLGYLSQPIFTNTKYRLHNYHKFLAVRHPFDRLVSAYQEKFLRGRYFPKIYRDLFGRVYKHRVHYDQYGVMRPTFSQFLGILVRFYHVGFNDRHWQSYYELCHPCDVQYDDVIKLETLGDDLHTFTRRYARSDADVERAFPTLNEERVEDEDKLYETSKLFAQVHPNVIQKLMEIYEKDFILFGYTWSKGHGARCDATKTKYEQLYCC